MSYESAPATKLLATHCAVCARALVDAVSVETGIGPDCRKKYGYNSEVDPEARAAANKIVYHVAVAQTGRAAADAATKLSTLGFHKLGARILERLVDITVTAVGHELKVTAPYSEEVVSAMRGVTGRRWDKDAKANFFPATSRNQVWAMLKRCFNGAVGMGPNGIFTVGAETAPAVSGPKTAPTQADAFANNARIDASKPSLPPNYFAAGQFHFTTDAITVDASDLALAVGNWPDALTVVGYGDVEEIRFKKVLSKVFEGETLMAVYQDLGGKFPPLRIFND